MSKINKLFCFGLVLALTGVMATGSLEAGPLIQKEKGSSQKSEEKTKPTKMPEKYRKWLEEEVVYIISRREKEVFKSLKTDAQREAFIRSFWKRRDPTPDTPLNEFREEHYRRIEYANRHFFEGIAGWRTDRGRIYIMFGPPDFFESNPGGGRGFLFGPSAPTAEFPSEKWVYRYIPGLKTRLGRVEFIFVNYYNSGKYQLVTDPALANALRNTSIASRDVGYEPETVQIPGETKKNLPINPLEQLQILAEVTKSRGEVLEEIERSARLRRLKGIVESQESITMMTFTADTSCIKGSGDYTIIPISIEVAAREIKFVEKDGRYAGRVNYYIEVKKKNKVIYQKSDRLEMKLRPETYRRRETDYYQYKHRLRLKPGVYTLHLVAWDEYSGHVGYVDRTIEVPDFPRQGFSLSDVILARNIEILKKKKKQAVYLDSKDIPELNALKKSQLKIPEKIKLVTEPEDPFTFGNLKINPNTVGVYSQSGELVFFYQIYNPTFSPQEKKAKLKIIHQIEKNGQVVALIDKPQEIHILESQKTAFLNSGARFSLAQIPPGFYTLKILVTDLVLNKTIVRQASFRVIK